MSSTFATVLLGALLQTKSIKGDCDSSGWTLRSSYALDSGNRAATTLIVDDCTIVNVGGGESDYMQALDVSADSPSWDTTWGEIDSISALWPTAKGAMFMRDTDGTYNESTMYITCDNDETGKIWSYDVSGESYTTLTDEMPSTSQDCCAVAFDGKIYIFGGQTESRRRMQPSGGGGSSSSESYDLVQIYDVDNSEWLDDGASMNTAREDMGCEMVVDSDGNGYVYVVGGAQGEEVLGSIEMYDITNDDWTEYSGVLDPERRGMGVQYIEGTDLMLILAGETCYDGEDCGTDGDNMLTTTEVFDISTGEIDDDWSDAIPDLTLGVAGAMTAQIDNIVCGIDTSNASITFYVMGGEYATDVDATSKVYTYCFDFVYNSSASSSDDDSAPSSLFATVSFVMVALVCAFVM